MARSPATQASCQCDRIVRADGAGEGRWRDLVIQNRSIPVVTGPDRAGMAGMHVSEADAGAMKD